LSVISPAGHARAQDSDDSQGTAIWSAPGTSNADESTSPDSKKPPLDVGGCWPGSAKDKEAADGVAYFYFAQEGTKISESDGSDLEFYWNNDYYIIADIKGTVSSDGVKFSLRSKGCSLNGSAKGDDSELKGAVHFSGACGKAFKDVKFTVEPGTGCL